MSDVEAVPQFFNLNNKNLYILTVGVILAIIAFFILNKSNDNTKQVHLPKEKKNKKKKSANQASTLINESNTNDNKIKNSSFDEEKEEAQEDEEEVSGQRQRQGQGQGEQKEKEKSKKKSKTKEKEKVKSKPNDDEDEAESSEGLAELNDEESTGSSSESSQSKNAKKKAKKKEAERQKKLEIEKEKERLKAEEEARAKAKLLEEENKQRLIREQIEKEKIIQEQKLNGQKKNKNKSQAPQPQSQTQSQSHAQSQSQAQASSNVLGSGSGLVDNNESEGEWTQIKNSNQNSKKITKEKEANNADYMNNNSNNANSDRVLSVDLIVPSRQHNIIIGKGGAHLKLLMEGTGASIKMPLRESNESKITLNGTFQQVSKCKGAIEALLKYGYSSITHPGQVHDDITVADSQLGSIIGPKGIYIKAISAATNTNIITPKPGSTGEKVVITGTKENIKLAKTAIKQLINEGFCPYTHSGYESKGIPFPKERVGWILGPRGSTINHLQNSIKVKINIPKNVDANGQFIITLVGLKENIIEAERQINKLLQPKTSKGNPLEDDEEDLNDNSNNENASHQNGDESFGSNEENPFSEVNTKIDQDDLW